MIINRITMKNFGIYYGSYLFDLRPTSNTKNIILIGGENGAGKTTILNAIKFSLYGALMLGVKSTTNNHINILRQKYYNNKAFDMKEPCVVEIDFNLMQNGYENQYKISRGLSSIKDSIKLTSNISKNGKILNKKDAMDFEDYIRKFLSPSVFEFFFFDGEKISDIFNNENYELHLRESIKSLFNIDVFETLQKDINLYLAQDNIFSTLTNEQKRYTKLNLERTNIEHSIKDKLTRIESWENNIIELKKNAHILEEDFKISGGLWDKERAKLNFEINQLENERKILNQEIREYVTDILPLSIPKQILLSLKEQLKFENEIHNYEIIKEKLSPAIFKEVIQKYMKQNNKVSYDLDSMSAFLCSYIGEAISPRTTESRIMHELSKNEVEQIVAFVDKVINFDHKLPQLKYKRINKINEKLNILRQLYKSNIENHKLEDLIETINKNNSEIIENEKELFVVRTELDELNSFLAHVNLETKVVKDKLIRATRDENVFNITQKVERVIESYKKITLNKRYVEIEKHFLEMFLKLIRKESFIKNVSLDTDTFDIILYDKEDHKLTKDNLSAGESQIYILSFIWAIINTSKRELPLIFDTLLGRLDIVHKHNIINHLLPNAGKQVIILSTNTELTPEAYNQIKKYVAKEYLLTFDNENKQVRIDRRYFFEAGE